MLLLTPLIMEKIAMKKSRFTEEQVTYALHQAEGGTAAEDVCRNLGIS
jgi:putative transposase